MSFNWPTARIIVILLRVAKALERANDLELHRQELEFPPFKPRLVKCQRIAMVFGEGTGREQYKCGNCGVMWIASEPTPVCLQLSEFGPPNKVVISRPNYEEWNEKERR